MGDEADDVITSYDALPASNPKLKEIQKAQDENEICKKVKKYCKDQWPDKDHVTPVVKPYWSVQGELTVVDGLLLKGARLVIPSSLQRQTLNQIHEGYQGINKCRERAKISVWWPGLGAKFAQFAKEWEFQHSTSSPRYPQANGEVERAVKTVKNFLKKEQDPTKALLAYRSTPLASGYSPAELLMGRKIKSTIPIIPQHLMP